METSRTLYCGQARWLLSYVVVSHIRPYIALTICADFSNVDRNFKAWSSHGGTFLELLMFAKFSDTCRAFLRLRLTPHPAFGTPLPSVFRHCILQCSIGSAFIRLVQFNETDSLIRKILRWSPGPGVSRSTLGD